ncbi:MAG: toprim domain-containing protein, partial [Deltaproteobacteria bacterium]
VAVVVEGYLDLIALQVNGIANVLATLGTALTREQVRLLKSLADQVVLVYDGDAAGAKAMKRAFPLFAQEKLAVRALPLPGGLDPDDYARSHGVELFQEAWDAAQPWFIYLLDDLINTHGQDIQGRVRVLEELRPFVAAISGISRAGCGSWRNCGLLLRLSRTRWSGTCGLGKPASAWGWMGPCCAKASPPWPPLPRPAWIPGPTWKSAWKKG